MSNFKTDQENFLASTFGDEGIYSGLKLIMALLIVELIIFLKMKK